MYGTFGKIIRRDREQRLDSVLKILERKNILYLRLLIKSMQPMIL